MSERGTLYEPETELVARIAAGERSELLEVLFESRTRRWRHPIVYVECGTIGLFGDLEQRASGAIAFGLIAAAIQIVFAQKDSDLRAMAFSLLSGLARSSGTTELPGVLAREWESLRGLAATLQPRDRIFWKELRKWYRRT